MKAPDNFSCSAGLTKAVRCWGNLDASIRNGTLKVSPVEVDQTLLLHPDVDEAVTFPVPDAKFGESVAAAIVLRKGASIRSRDLKWFAFTHLPSHKIPQRLLVLDAIPRVARDALARALGLTATARPASVYVIQTHGDGVPLFVVGAIPEVRSSRPIFRICEPDLSTIPQPHTVEHVAAECVHALRRFQPDGPYALGASHASRGIAIEMARQIEQTGDRIEFVALFKSEAEDARPHLPYDRRHSWPGRTIDVGVAGI